MVNNRYVRGIAFILMLGMVYVVMAASPSVLTTIRISPVSPTPTVGNTVTFNAVGYDQSGNTTAITPAVAWSSSNSATGTIDTSGKFTALAAGTTTITAKNGSGGTITNSTTMTVTGALSLLTTIRISPIPVTPTVGDNVTFNAVGYDQSGNTIAIAPAVVWNSSNAVTGTIDTSGKFTALRVGTTTITARNGSGGTITNSTTFSVIAPKPAIISWSNNFTENNAISLTIRNQTFVNFNVTANQPVTYSWYYDGKDQATNYDNFTYQFLSVGPHTITANISNSTNSDNKTWNINVKDSTPPANITGLTLVSSGKNWLNWSWTNPDDPDFAYVAIWINNAWHNTTSNVTNFFNTSSSGITLASETAYIIATHTVDNSGNVNSDWINLTNSTLPPSPIITKVNSTDTIVTAGSSTQIFDITVSQDANVTWTIGSFTQLNSSVPKGTHVTLVYTLSTPGNYTVLVTATNKNGSDTESWNWTVHSTTYFTGNRIWDGGKRNDYSLTYSWTPQSFSGFYYNAKDNVGTETINITMSSYDSRSISTGNLDYSTSPQEVSFTYSNFGKYQVIGFMADKYFAGYTNNTGTKITTRPTTDFTGLSSIAQGGLHRVLIDDDTKRTISVGGTLALQDGYVLKAKDIDLNARTMLLSLLKDGNEVDVAPLSADQTYVYTKTVGGVESLPLIMVRFDSVFSGQELQVAFMKGLFQISEATTVIQTGNQFGNMKVTRVDLNGIAMENSASIGLSKGTTASVMGDIKIQVANVDSPVRFALTVAKTGSFEVRSTIYDSTATSPVMAWTPYNFGMNIGDTSIGFYYDLDDDVGNETLSVAPFSGRSIPDNSLKYSTTPDEVKFTYNGFGKYQVIGFMADKYFAGYTDNTGVYNGIPITTRPTTAFGGISTISQGSLHKILIDDDTKRTIAVGSTIALQEGYVIKATDIDLNARTMLLSLLKDGTEVDVSPLSAGETYVYTKTVGGTESLPLIMVRFESVFSGQELQVAFLKGLFQISDNPTTVRVGDRFGHMEVTSISGSQITMSNSGSIGLEKNKNDVLMGNLKLKVADTDAAVRFYFAVDVTQEMIVNKLVINSPSKAMAGDTIQVKVTAGGKPVDNASLTLDTDMGTTDSSGLFNYTLPRTLKAGAYAITATKIGYDKATNPIQIDKYVDYTLSMEAPSNANQYDNITIKVLYNGTAISGATVLFDNTSIGTTDDNGQLIYMLDTSGTHTITASKKSYITVSRDIDIKAPYSDFRSLDINVTPNPVFTNEFFTVTSNITNLGTKKDTLPVELIINGSSVDNRSVTLGPGEKVPINFTIKEAIAANYTVEIMGQSTLLEVKEKPTNYFVIVGIVTLIGIGIIYFLTSKGLLSLELLKQKFNMLFKK